ncbi:MAG: hypothetical protein AAF567_01925 [Actinomycetota bacterium]
MSARLENNLRLYPLHQMFAGALFWMPTIVLFLVEELGFARALSVQAVYYIAVVVLELPTGWLSDRLGRVLALRLVTGTWIASHLTFVFAPNVAGLLAAQVLLAAGYAFLSGTDVTFHFDTLEALGRSDEFVEREARSRQRLLLVTAGSALLGGAVGLIDLRVPFALSALAACAQGIVASRLVEPAVPGEPADDTALSGSPSETAESGRFGIARGLRHPALLWVAVYLVFQVVVIHLVADLSGPYLAESIGASSLRDAALITGVSAAAAALMGAFIVSRVPAMADRFGSVTTLVVAAVVPVAVLVVMALTISPWILALLPLRVLPRASASVIAPAIVGRHIDRQARASFLSLASLGGRLAFGAVMIGIGLADLALGPTLTLGAIVGAVLWTLVMLFQRLAIDATDIDRERVAHQHSHLHVHWGSHGHVHAEHRIPLRVHRHGHEHGHEHGHRHEPSPG